MKTFLIFVLLFISTNSYAQNKFVVEYFSSNYYCIVYITNSNNTENPGWIAIYDNNSNEELIRVESEGINLDLNDEKTIENNNILPYNEQSLIIYEDFNFDGVEDFAIQDSHHGGYGSPTYRIYISEDNKFVYNEKFTELGQDYLGMFNVDHEKKIISTMQKSGCCYHEYSDFIVENNVPKVISIITEDATKEDEYVYITTEKYIDGNWTTTTRKEKIKDYYKE